MKKYIVPCWEHSSKILILNLSYNQDGADKFLEVFIPDNLFWVKYLRLSSHDWGGKVPAPSEDFSRFSKDFLIPNVVENVGRFSDNLLSFLKLFKRQQF